MGATALFGEKYGNEVRVVKMGDISIELCGGTHLKHTAQVGLFKLVSESSIGAGIRRIEAVTGEGAIALMHEAEDQLRATAEALGVPVGDVVSAAERNADALKELQREIGQMKSKGAAEKAGDLAESAQEVGGVKYVTATMPTVDVPTLQKLADVTIDKLKSGVVVLAGVADGKILFVGKVSPDLVEKGFHAGNTLREVAKVAGGGGGGKAEFAQAGGKDASKVDEALAKAVEIIKAQAG
jgi:alanyl-tRNA synthetase